jgi:PmbA protein
MPTTANAGGIHNILLSGSDASQEDLIKSISKGLLVTELIGHGVNTVTGDYSRGASGFWIENGEIKQAVEEITIAGNLKDIFKNIKALGNDTDMTGTIRCGSVLVDELTVAGSKQS